MRWDDSHESPDIVDRRGEGPVDGGGGGSGLFFLVFWLLRRPWGWVVLLVLGLGYAVLRFSGALDGDDSRALHGGQSGTGVAPGRESPEVHFVGFVLDDVQTTWSNLFFAERGRAYRHAKLVLYTDSTRTGCGIGSAATGPFYCPADEQIYLDLGFFRELSGKLGARGQFAQAYVIAHEMGHHVQKLLGVDMSSVGTARGATSGSVRLELQADCYAGIWAHSTKERNLLDSGDIDSALGAAAAVGDDRLQRMATGTVSPEAWTHGSSAERKRWFTKGYTSGKLADCDTFGASSL
ncbi:MAG: neutral zinc metallopeptidase [Polyangiaceae bacterium]|jgi:predicted metalloprotease